MKINTAMIFAAGMGSRMRPLTDTIPKPMVKVCGKPLIDYSIDKLIEVGVERIVINTHHLAGIIESHLSKRKDVEIIISHEDTLLETGGGIVKALPHLGNEPFYVLNSDAIFRCQIPPPLAGGGGGGVSKMSDVRCQMSEKLPSSTTDNCQLLAKETPPPTPPASGGGEKVDAASGGGEKVDAASGGGEKVDAASGGEERGCSAPSASRGEDAIPALQRLADFWNDSKMDLLFLLHPVNKAIGYTGKGDFELCDDGLLEWKDKVAPFVFTGVQIMHPRILEGYKPVYFSLLEVFKKALETEKLYGIQHVGEWIEVGSVEGIEIAENFLKEKLLLD